MQHLREDIAQWLVPESSARLLKRIDDALANPKIRWREKNDKLEWFGLFF